MEIRSGASGCIVVAVALGQDVWADVNVLARDRRTAAIATQLLRAVGSIGANIAEGFSRASPRDRARHYEYALGSARESDHWLQLVHPLLGSATVNARRDVLTSIRRQLLVIIPQQRRSSSPSH